MKKLIISITFVISFAAILKADLEQQPGTLDPAFGTMAGFSTVSGTPDAVQAIIQDNLGRFITAGFGGGQFVIIRFNSDGSVDLPFGGMGTGFNSQLALGTARDLVCNREGQFILAGSDGSNGFTVARYTKEGLVDTTFGGSATGFNTNTLAGTASAFAMVQDSLGRLIVVGREGTDAALARFTKEGLIDNSFGSTAPSYTVFDFGGAGGTADDVIMDSNGRLIIAGASGGNLAIARFDSDGNLDTSFGDSAGFTVTSFAFGVEELVQDKQGRFIVSGASGTAAAVARFNADGSVDTTFGTNGIAIFDLSGANDDFEYVLLDSQGRIVLAGFAGSDTVIMRLNTDGTPDTPFGTSNGFSIVDFGGTDSARTMIETSSGRYVIAGVTGSDALIAQFFGEKFSPFTIAIREKYCAFSQCST